ncbi:MAG: hypothetical protein KIT80_02850 [Chitinophagaceae bacterium]|nr:hypothetical protein [Chitinophagaceae bacterium]MCW5925824.1 hypothetical protein [Chitinophagaceae bacterium]
MDVLKKIFFFTRECYYTSREEKKYYWVEINDKKWAFFYKAGLLKESFYSEKLNSIDDEVHTKQYLQILLRSIIMVQDN